jgi:hypothetical protein
VVTRLSRAAAAVGANQPERALADLDELDRRLADPRTGAILVWAHATAEDVTRAYRLIVSGLRARANRELGRLDAEAQAITARHTILDERLAATHREEIEREEMLAEAQLAWNAADRHDRASAARWLLQALTHADDLRARAHGVRDREQLDVLWLAAQLSVSLGTTLVPDLPNRLADASAEITARREPSLRRYARWFEIELPLLKPAAVGLPRAEVTR